MKATKEEMLAFGEWMRRERAKLRLSKKDLAEGSGVSYITIRQLESSNPKALGPDVRMKLETYFSKGRPVIPERKKHESSAALCSLADRIVSLKKQDQMREVVLVALEQIPPDCIPVVYNSLLDVLENPQSGGCQGGHAATAG